MQNRRHRRGFTLVELSIVLVIIGLIIGGVLTGQQIIQNARVTNALNTIQAYQAQFQTYVQNYGALPGDDSNAATRFSGVVPPSPIGNGDGTLQGAFDSANPNDESRLVWMDMRAAGLVKNQVGTGNSTAVQPPNPFNGVYGFQNGAFSSAFTTAVLCLNNVPAAAAQAIDSRLDDGTSNLGSIQSMAGTGTTGEAINGTIAVNYGTAQTYTMCIRM
ncbi:MAG: prepilin-type N-terminal cleavage/methylation domain-containing protein [Alphaproteobacteria bacterium]|nr:prepilin-type N-terminal cleavage/methylation domain-containing protein [Alphaproteobacteria bacterium]